MKVLPMIDPLDGLLPMNGTPGSAILFGVGILIVCAWYLLNKNKNKDK